MNLSTHRAPNMWHSGAPYSPAVRAGDLIFVSGAVAIDPTTGETLGDDIGTQTTRILSNIEMTLEAAGSSLDRVVKTTVFLTDLNLLDGMNEVYRKFFPNHLPARSTVEVGPLARKEFLIEIEAIAIAAD